VVSSQFAFRLNYFLFISTEYFKLVVVMFAYLYRTLYDVLLEPNDDFFTRCRKGVITCAFLFGIVHLVTKMALSPMSRQIVNGIFAILGLWLLYLVKNQFFLLITKTTGAVHLVLDITKKLAVFDLEGALALLVSAQEQFGGILDPEFEAALKTMINNLALFRPHIPNTLIDKVKTEQAHQTVDQHPLVSSSDDSDFSDCSDDSVDDQKGGGGGRRGS